MKKVNAIYKLNALQIDDAHRKFEQGWRISWIAAIFDVHRSTIYFHVRYNGWIRRVRVLKMMPEEVVVIYRERKKNKYREKFRGSYDFIKMSAEQIKIQNCRHSRWIKRCSICGMILASDAVDHETICEKENINN